MKFNLNDNEKENDNKNDKKKQFEDKIISGVYESVHHSVPNNSGVYESVHHNVLNNFKAKDLKLYSNTENYVDGKKYGKVFYGPNVAYIYADFEIYNLLFNIKDWNLTINYKIYDFSKYKIADFNYTFTVKKEDNVAVLTKWWGDLQKGKIWKKNSYIWEIWIENKKIFDRYFYIEDFGKVKENSNPFFEIRNIRLYKSTGGYLPVENRCYLKVFRNPDAKYINIEIKALNKNPNQLWNCEILYIIRKENGELKCKYSQLRTIYRYVEMINLDFGWGCATGNYYGKGNYNFEVYFMDCLIANIPFRVDDFEQVSNYCDHLNPFPEYKFTKVEKKIETKNDYLNEINELVALESIKKDLTEYSEYLKFCGIKSNYHYSFKQKQGLNMVFTGNPGTGKTTVAKLLGKIFRELGLLTSGHVHEVSRPDLIGEYIGHTAGKVRRSIDKARGGILFIDEAYSLARLKGDKLDFGNEAVEVLVKEMSDGLGNLIVIVAGYPEEMKTFLDSNPGLRSRFNKHFTFPDYTPDELWDILNYSLNQRQILMSEDVKVLLYPVIVELYRNRDNSFGNARLINQILDKAEINMGIRCLQNKEKYDDKNFMKTLIADDFRKIFDDNRYTKFKIPIDVPLLDKNMKEMNGLIGLQSVKSEISDMIKLVKYFKNTGSDRLNNLSFNYLFFGNPGTGKTTVARILGGILKALGILEKGHLIECDRRMLVGNFIGETALKTGRLIEKSLGGILFIDEAYSLSEGGEQDFGREAIEVLLKEMEDKRGQFGLICAGYPDKMTNFINSNPGFKSRFEKLIYFDDYTTEELFEISKKIFSDNKLEITDTAGYYLKELIAKIINLNNHNFGNARDIRKVVNYIIGKHFLWVADLDSKKVILDNSELIDFPSLIDLDFSNILLNL